jgi:hypothetical protein
MFEKNLSSKVGTRCLVGGFVGCSAGIHRLGKKIGGWKFLIFGEKFTF